MTGVNLDEEFYQGQNFWKQSPSMKMRDYELNDSIIEQAEALLSVKLPPSLIRLLKIQNGGELEYPYFQLPVIDEDGSRFERQERFPSIDPIHFRKDDLSLLSSQELLAGSGLADERLIVLWTDFHFWVVLDYREHSADPAVLYIAEDFEASTYDRTEWEYSRLAGSFDEFLAKLYRIKGR
ncbi:SMI1/KNR4 family protein [Peribacillus sp. SCS-26]|uniref:SMI1/KNR4 family protein n=1 Tax=Paraperibacillus marinus TaxID=3115295 RepID=UPI0039062698